MEKAAPLRLWEVGWGVIGRAFERPKLPLGSAAVGEGGGRAVGRVGNYIPTEDEQQERQLSTPGP